MRKSAPIAASRKGRSSEAEVQTDIGVLAANQEHASRAQDEMRAEIRALNGRLTEILDRLGKTATSEEVRHMEKRLGEVRVLSERLEGTSSNNTLEIEKLKLDVSRLSAEVGKKADIAKVEEEFKPLMEQKTRVHSLWLIAQFVGFGGLAAWIGFMGMYGNKPSAPPTPAQYPPAVQGPARAPIYEYEEEEPPAPRKRRRLPSATNPSP
jgi:hypothetical protein